MRHARAIARLLFVLCAALLLAAPPPAQAQGLGVMRVSAVKAAFLYKFGSFVEWPAGAFRSPTDALVIGVFGDEAVASELEQITLGRRIENHPIVVRRVQDADDVPGLHMLFAGGTRDMRAREVLAAARGAVLTVADSASVGRAGAAVLAFTEDEGRVRFSASLTAATVRGLRLSARLLAVAQEVEGR